jgi:hypothetical protein
MEKKANGIAQPGYRVMVSAAIFFPGSNKNGFNIQIPNIQIPNSKKTFKSHSDAGGITA